MHIISDIDRPLVHKSADKLQTSMNPTMVIPETSDLGATSADKRRFTKTINLFLTH